MHTDLSVTQPTLRDVSCPGQSSLLRDDSTIVEARSRPKASRRKKLLELGSVLDGIYEIRRVLGRGGMGQVYEARDRSLNRIVAIKVPWTQTHCELLEQEAKALAALQGRGVPCVYAVSRRGDLGYCVMERLYGRTLLAYMVQRFADGQFCVDEGLDILIGVADALGVVHDAGLIHRDLKPSNIMLAPANRVVLFDFGLFSTESKVAVDAKICGSPRYIAPEVITATMQIGQAHLLDVYALGVIGFMMFIGRPPFDGSSVTHILSKHVSAQPPRLDSLRSDVPARLASLVAQMLAKEPEERTFSAHAVASGLRAVRDANGEPDAGEAPATSARVCIGSIPVRSRKLN